MRAFHHGALPPDQLAVREHHHGGRVQSDGRIESGFLNREKRFTPTCRFSLSQVDALWNHEGLMLEVGSAGQRIGMACVEQDFQACSGLAERTHQRST